jgi:membrane protein DedA with SNARE-associated domain
MADFILWVREFVVLYPVLGYGLVFLGVGFGGEAAMIGLAFLLAQKFFSLVPFFIVSFLGVLFTDTLWFFLGKTRMAGRILDHKYTTDTVFLITEAIRKVSRGNHLLAMIFAKFLIGTRLVLILYVSRTNIPFKKFINANMVAILVWLLILIPIGYLSGLGFTYFSKVLNNIYVGIGFLASVFLLFIIGQMWLKKTFTKEGEEILEEKNL